MKNKFLLFAALLFVACDPIGRMTGNSTRHDEKASAQAVVTRLYEGNFTNTNFVDVDLAGMTVISVWIKRDGSWIEVPTYDKDLAPKTVFYMLGKNTVIFSNLQTKDFYSIKVTK